MGAQLEELKRLTETTNALWKQGGQTNWESFSHTEAGIKKHDIQKRSNVVQGFMSSMTKNNNKTVTQQVQQVKKQVPTNTRQSIVRSGMMFGR